MANGRVGRYDTLYLVERADSKAARYVLRLFLSENAAYYDNLIEGAPTELIYGNGSSFFFVGPAGSCVRDLSRVKSGFIETVKHSEASKKGVESQIQLSQSRNQRSNRT